MNAVRLSSPRSSTGDLAGVHLPPWTRSSPRPSNGNLPYSVDPATTLAFPLELAPKSLTSSLALVGFGVRTVSFLRVKVYSAGFYVPEGKDGRWGTERMGEQEAMESFLKDGAPCAMRIGACPPLSLAEQVLTRRSTLSCARSHAQCRLETPTLPICATDSFERSRAG